MINSFQPNDIELDEDGFLLSSSEWNQAIAEQLATSEGIKLNSQHWELINSVQHYYAEFELSPAMRPLIKYLKNTLNPEINSIYLLKLFPGSPAKLLSKIAGLPKPENCF